MKTRFFILTAISILIIGIGYFWITSLSTSSVVLSPLGELGKEKLFEKYSIDALSETTFFPSDIVFNDVLATESSYTVQTFHFLVNGKKVTGLMHIPAGVLTSKKIPVVIQLRGYVDKEIYTTGEGTKRSAQVFAENGFLSLAPDFLGYGGSDEPSGDALEDRFLTYTTALQLLSSIQTIPFADTDNIFIWGHSNGGHIALTLATILGDQGYPTTVWAPVSKPFPYSVLYYTDEFDDEGKALRKVLADFEKEYDIYNYSMTHYLDRITIPVQLHQGTADEAVPVSWNDEFVEKLKGKGKDIQYFRYTGADHNMMPNVWNTVVRRDVSFFTSFL